MYFQEFAGLGGNVEFFKHDMELQFNQKLVLDTVRGLTFKVLPRNSRVKNRLCLIFVSNYMLKIK